AAAGPRGAAPARTRRSMRSRDRRSAHAAACAPRAGGPRRSSESVRASLRAQPATRCRRALRASSRRGRPVRDAEAEASPARTGIRRAQPARAPTAARSTLHARGALQAQLLGDHHALYLVRTFPDLEDLLVTVQARDRIFLGEAVAAVDLQGRVA